MSAVTIAAIAGIATAGIGIAGAAGAFSPDAPTPLNYGQLTRDAQQAQIDLLPAKYAAQAQYDPKFAALQNRISYQNMFGTPGGKQDVTYTDMQTVPATYRLSNNIPANIAQFAGLKPGDTLTQQQYDTLPLQYKSFASQLTSSYQLPITRTKTVDQAATPGFLDMLDKAEPRLEALGARANTATRTADINDVANLGPQALAALKAYDPQSTQLMDKLASQAGDELSAGSSMTPSEEREVQQYVRQGQSSRGLGMGPTDVFTEAMNLGQYGQQRLQQRQAFASGVVNQRTALYGDPFLTITGRTSGRSQNPNSYINPYPTSLQNPGNAPYSIAQGNQAYTNQANIAGYNQQMSSMGSLLKTDWGGVMGQVGGIFGGSGSGSGGRGFMSGNSSYF